MTPTNIAYDKVINSCQEIFIQKNRDYGQSWRCLRTISLIDQIWIKAKRIRNLQELARKKQEQMVSDDLPGEYRGIINYCVMGMFADNIPEQIEWTEDTLLKCYNSFTAMARETMLKKNHDYGEAWRDLSQESFTDLILQKLSRMKQIWNSGGKPLVSEGISANYIDIINYSVFALILINESHA